MNAQQTIPPASPSLEQIARSYEWTVRHLADLQSLIGAAEACRADAARAFAKALADAVGTHELEVDGIGYRAHRDGSGVHRRRLDR